MSSALTIRDRRRVVITAVALIVAACEGAAIVHYLLKPAVLASAPVPVRVLAPTPPPPQHVTLAVQSKGHLLRLKWDRTAAAVRDATRATLDIEDGTYQSRVDLDSTMLQAGVLSYFPETRNVEFRLDLFTPGRRSRNRSAR